MTDKEKYKPTAVDIAFAKNVTELIRDGGIWAYPDTGIIYQVDKKKKRLVVIGAMGSSDEAFRQHRQRMHERTKVVFGAIGYDVEPLKSYKVEVQTDDTGAWYTNAIRYPSREVAEREGRDLAGCWTAVKAWRVAESEDEPNR